MSGPIFGLLFWLVLQPGSMPALAAPVTVFGELEDRTRQRQIMYKALLPNPGNPSAPTVIISHGLGGSRESLTYLGLHLAENGFVAIHIQHPGSDRSIFAGKGWRLRKILQALRDSIKNPQNAIDRFDDLPFVVGELKRLDREDPAWPLRGWIDFARLGMAGHSYGARSTMIAAGEAIGRKFGYNFKEPAIKAGLLLSPDIPGRKRDLTTLYDDIEIPLFHITGTDDESRVRKIDPRQRLLPYKHIKAPGQYLLVFDGADHMTFSGRRIDRQREKPDDQRHIATVKAGALAFFRATLKRDSDAARLLKRQFPDLLMPADRFVFK